MNSVVGTIDAEVEGRSLLKHPFYKSWSAGALTLDDLAGYSMEYFGMVLTVPELVENARSLAQDEPTRRAISEILSEERTHVGMWRRFAESLGVSAERLDAHVRKAETDAALGELSALSQASLIQAAAIMYAIETEQPKISRTKLDGLQKFYGMDGSGSGTLYFREHEEADVRHAAVWRSILSRVDERGRDAAIRAAVTSLQAQNRVLDSVMKDCRHLSNS